MCSKPTGGTSQYLYFLITFFSGFTSFFVRSLGERDRVRRRFDSRSRERSRCRRDAFRSRDRERDERRLALSIK